MTAQVSEQVARHVGRMKKDAGARVMSMTNARAVRRGQFSLVWPDKFSNEYPEPIVANFIDQAARDLASNLAPLPGLACAAGRMRTEADKRRAENKNRIGWNYWRESDLQTAMKYGADQYITYGFLPLWVEADYKRKKPVIHVMDPIGCFFDVNRWRKTERFAWCYRKSFEALAVEWPEYAPQILRDRHGMGRSGDTEVTLFIDATSVTLYLGDCDGLILSTYEHGLSHCPVHVALRPGVETDPRGQFDDVLWVQLAHAVMAALTLEAGHKSVQAPIAVPSDVQEVPLGPDGLMVTDQPDKIRRVQLDVPPAAFALGQQLEQEMKTGIGYPDTRLGVGPAGGTTGRGVSALEGGFDSQIKQGQDVLGETLRQATETCFEMDAKLWPRVKKTINGLLSGESFEISYVPAADIGDNYSCEVTYGFASGVSQNSAIVTLLQLQGGDIIGRDTVRRNLPFDIDPDQQQREVDEQIVESAFMQSLAAGMQAAAQAMAQGQPQVALTFYRAAVQVIQGRQNGEDVASLIQKAFIDPTEQQEEQAEQAQQAAQQAGPDGGGGDAGGGGGPLDGIMPNGLPMGVAAGQAGLPPGGRPSVQDMVAGFTAGGKASMGDSIHRRIATG